MVAGQPEKHPQLTKTSVFLEMTKSSVCLPSQNLYRRLLYAQWTKTKMNTQYTRENMHAGGCNPTHITSERSQAWEHVSNTKHNTRTSTTIETRHYQHSLSQMAFLLSLLQPQIFEDSRKRMNESVRGPFLSREAEIFRPWGAFYTTGSTEGPPVQNGWPAGSSALTIPSAS